MQNGVIKMIMLYLKYKKESIIQLISMYVVFFLVIWLYNLPYYNAFIFAMELYGVIYVTYMIYDYCRFVRKYKTLEENLKIKDMQSLNLPQKENVIEGMYGRIIKELLEQKKRQFDAALISGKNLKDYYACWAHQIKTPIAAMRLTLQNTDSSLSRKLSVELARVEQYVDMVLCYLRLDTDTRDYVIAVYDLDDILRQALRKFAGQFIGKKIHLDYQPLNAQVMTDEKWLLFVIEQILSNALKYTQQGCVSIYLESPKILCIRDTGMGIAAEDLPRIFEKGYTGYNGRTDKKASGLGLYLCARICRNLGHGISAESEPDKGTVIKLNLNTAERMFE